MSKPSHQSRKKQFYCPLGYGIMWWRGLQYSECPLSPMLRNMPDCRECKLKIDKDFVPNKKEYWEDKVRKPRKKKDKRRKKR